MTTPKDLLYPIFLDAAYNPDSRGMHTKFFGKGPAKIALGFDYSIAEVFMTTSHKNVVRGMHLQTPGQPKLIQVITGEIRGNMICCNPDLPSFGQALEYSLTPDSGRILVPGDWALGYRSLADDTRVLYFAGADFAPGGDAGIDPFDTALDLNWGLNESDERFTAADAILSEKDLTLPSFQVFAENLAKK